MEHEALIFDLARRAPSFYLYDGAAITRQARRLLRDFPDTRLLYSVKANPHPQITKLLFSLGLGADAASPQEVRLAAGQGLGPRDIYYSAPGKTDAHLRSALPLSTLVADSLGEVRRIQVLAEEEGLRVPIGLRINPDCSFGGGPGLPSKFGVDEPQALAALPALATLPNVELTGLHVHLRSQSLDTDALSGYYTALFSLAHRFTAVLGRPLDFLNLGSGLGIPYSPADRPLDTAALGALVRRLGQGLPQTRILVETGRYVVGQAGSFVTTVVDKKVSHGKTFLLLDSTLNGFLRPTLAQLILGCTDAPCPAEPLFTGPDSFQFLPLPHREEREVVTLAGSLCTAADIIARDVALPRMEAGDLLMITNAGSYAATLSPVHFSSRTPPAQFCLAPDGRLLEDDV